MRKILTAFRNHYLIIFSRISTLFSVCIMFTDFAGVVSLAQSVPPIEWSEPVNVSDTPGWTSKSPVLALGGNTIHATWWDDDAGTYPGEVRYKRSLDEGKTWGDPHTFTTQNYHGQRIVALGDTVIAFWNEYAGYMEGARWVGTMFCSRSTDGGITWSEGQPLSALGTYEGPIAYASEGHAVVAWLAPADGGGSSAKLLLSDDAGASWEGNGDSDGDGLIDPIDVPLPGPSYPNVDVVIAGPVIVVGVLIQSWGEAGKIYCVRSDDWGQTWSTKEIYVNDSGPNTHPMQLRLGAFGSSITAYWGTTFGSGIYAGMKWVATSLDSGLTWSDPILVAQSDDSAPIHGDVCMNGSRALIFWIDQTPSRYPFYLYYRRSLDGGFTWEAAQRIPTGLLQRFDGAESCVSTENSVYVAGSSGEAGRDIWLFRGSDPTLPDTIPPTLSAEWIPLKVEEDEGEFRLEFSATDTSDPAPQVVGVIVTPSLDGLEIKLKVKSEVKVEFELDKGKVKIEGPDPDALLAQLQQYGGLVVESGQLVKVELDDDDEGEQEFKFDKNGKLKLEAASATLQVTAEDASGNTSTIQVSPQFTPDDDDHDHDDDHCGDKGKDKDDDKDKDKDKSKAAPTPLQVISSASQLTQNYPNPFNPETWIPYHLSQDASVIIRIYNASGRLVRLFDLGHQTAGFYTSRDKAAYWDGRNSIGERVASGTYFYTLKAGDFTATRRMIIMQ